MSAGRDAGFPLADFRRMLSVTSPLAVAAGIMLVMLSGFAEMAVHLVPLVLYSMRLDTPVTVSLYVSSVMPSGDAVAAPGTITLFVLEDGTVAVAFVRTITTAGASPISSRVIDVPVTVVHVVSLSKQNSIEPVTPVTRSVEPLYTALGAALRAGADTVRVAEANAVSVAIMRT